MLEPDEEGQRQSFEYVYLIPDGGASTCFAVPETNILFWKMLPPQITTNYDFFINFISKIILARLLCLTVPTKEMTEKNGVTEW